MTAALALGDIAVTWRAADTELDDVLASPAGLSPRELAARLVELDRVRRAVEAATVAVLDEAQRSGADQDDGCLNVSSWARCQVLWSRHEATTRVREVELVRLCPEVGDALADGRLGIAQAAELARARANPRCGDDIAEHITQLLAWASELGFDGFRKVVRRWEQLADVDGAHRDHQTSHQTRRASFQRIDNAFHLRAQHGIMHGTAMEQILDAFVEAEYQAEWEAIQAEHGDKATQSMMTRSASQLRADALYAIFIAAVTGEGHTISDPLVNIVVDLATFEEHVARLVGGNVPTPDTPVPDIPVDHDQQHPDEADDPGDPLAISVGTGFGLRRCETINGDPVDLNDMIAAALIGHVRRVVVNQAGVAVDSGRKSRLFRGVARSLVWLLEKTCCWPSCGHRVDLQVDHLKEFSRLGPTDQHNAAPLHGRHNRLKTALGYRITRDPNGFLHIRRPDGTEIHPR